MKKLLAFTLLLASVVLVALPDEAKALESAIVPTATFQSQVRVQIGRNAHFNHRVRVVTRTRIVHVGRRVFRETYQIRYLPNGRVDTRLISRIRIR